MSSQSRWSLFLFALAVAVRVLFHQYTEFVADDAYITFRYAYNLAHGYGFVYNLNERVLGTTTPLFTFVLSFFGALHLDIPRMAVVAGLFASGVTALLIYRLALHLRFTHWAPVPAIAFAVWPRSVVVDSCGMETPLFALFVFSAIHFHTKRLPIYALAMGTIATLTRPEGLWILALLVAVYLHRHRDRWVQILVTPSSLLIPWIAFATWYFGSPLPNSVSGKLALYGRWGISPWWDKLFFYMSWHNPVGWIMTVAAVFGALWLWRKQNWGRLAIVWLVGMILFYVMGDARVFFWYAGPLYPVMLLLAAAALPWLCGAYPVCEDLGRRYAPLAFALVAILSLPGLYSAAKYYRDYQNGLNDCHRAVASFLSTHVLDTELVAAEDIGYMGYYSHKRILDRDGLVSPEAIPYTRAGDYGGLVRDFKPEWLVVTPDTPLSAFIADSGFRAKYTSSETFRGADCRYLIFRRN